MDLDVLFINPSALQSIYQGLSHSLAALEPPIWAALLANFVRHQGKRAHIIDCEGEGLTLSQTMARVKEYRPKLIVVVVYGQQPSASTQNMHGASLVCQALKEQFPEHKVLLVGGHVSALPQRTLMEEAADFVCQGEGPATIWGLLQCNMNDESQLVKVPSLWFRQERNGERKARFTFKGPNISQEKLSTLLPGMAFDLLPMKNYRAHNWHCFGDDRIESRQPYASVYTSLGCPYRCSFCCINAPFGGASFRYWQPEFMIKQFDILAMEYGIKNVKIADEMFVLNEKHFLKLCELLKERNYGFNIWAYARVDTVKKKYLRALKEAGVNWLVLGIESKSSYVRNGVVKGRFDEQDIVQVVRDIQSEGIHVLGNYIFGLPDETKQTMQETLDLSLELNCEMANFYSAMAYPGSELYHMAQEFHWPLPETWLGYSQHAYECLPLPSKHLRAGEILSYRDEAWKIYFTSPKYLSMVKEKFGEKTYQHVLSMTQYDLKRKYAE